MRSWQSDCAHVPTDVSCIFALCDQWLLCHLCQCFLLSHTLTDIQLSMLGAATTITRCYRLKAIKKN